MGIIDRLRFRLGINSASAPAVYQEVRVHASRIPPELEGEISKVDANLAFLLGAYRENPDELVEKKGLSVYKQMLDDDQVRAALTTKKFAALSAEWSVQPGDVEEGEQEEAERQADFIRWNFEHMAGTLEDALLDILSALEYGYSITEKVFYVIPDGEFAGMIGLKKLGTRAPFDYRFQTDAHNNIDLKAGIVFTPEQTKFALDKFIVYSYNRRFGDPYGQSDLKAAYRSWLSKNFVIKFWNIFLEKFSIPTLQAIVPLRHRKQTSTDIMNILKNWQAANAIKVPEDIKLEIIESTRRGGTDFVDSIREHNTMIARSILVPDLIGFTELKGGSYALGRKQFNVFLWVVQKIIKDLQETIVNEQIIRQLIDLNFNNVPAYPYLKFEELTDENVEMKATILGIAVQNGVVDPLEPWVREYLQMPAMPEGFNPQPRQPTGTGAGGGGLFREKKGKKRANQVAEWQCHICGGKEATIEHKGFYDVLTCENGHLILRDVTGQLFRLRDQAWELDTAHVPHAGRTYQEEGNIRRFDKQVKYKEIERGLDSFQEEAVENLKPFFMEARDKMIGAVDRAGFFETLDENILKTLEFSLPAQFKQVLKALLIKTHLFGVLNALSEMSEKEVPLEIKAKFQDVPLGDWIDIEPEKALELFEKKVSATIIKTKAGVKIKKALKLFDGSWLKYYDRTAFAITGIEEAEILKQAKMVLLEGIRTEGPSRAKDRLSQLFGKYWQKDMIQDGKVLTPGRLNTIVRTNFSDAFNEGRWSMFKDPDVKDFVEVLRWDSVIDRVTTAYCLAMDGKQFRADDPNLIPPPAHWNCRSLLSAVTTIEVEREANRGTPIETTTVANVEREDKVQRQEGFGN